MNYTARYEEWHASFSLGMITNPRRCRSVSAMVDVVVGCWSYLVLTHRSRSYP